MIKLSIRFLIIFSLNYLILILSQNIDVEQIKYDIELTLLFRPFKYNMTFIYVVICTLVTSLTLLILRIFRPFMEIYLIYYLKINFYFFVSLVSLSSIYLILRVYGYSRFLILIYLFSASFLLLVTDKMDK